MTHGYHMVNYNTQITLHSQIKMLNRFAASTLWPKKKLKGSGEYPLTGLQH